MLRTALKAPAIPIFRARSLSPKTANGLVYKPLPIITSAKMTARKTSSKVPEGIVEDHSQGPMLRFENSLPLLPVPSLEETAKRYLRSVHPITSKKQYQHTEKVVSDFIRPGGVGHQLQRRLVAFRDDPNVRNWITEWWNDSAYLGFREPVVPYVSYFYSHRDDRKRRNPAKRAAAITSAVLHFQDQVDKKTLEPEYLQKHPLAMSSYQWMFNACRVPAKPSDYPIKYSSQEHPYLVVIRKNHFFKVPHYAPDRSPLNTAEFEKIFLQIYKLATGSVDAVGALTSLNRDKWTEARDKLITLDPKNAEIIQTIEASSFVICLDDAAPVTLEDRARQYWLGDGQNRWFDKPLQFIVNNNGTSGFLGEHSMMDGTPTHRINDYINKLIFTNGIDFSNPTVRPNALNVTELTFSVDESVRFDIAEAKRHFQWQTVHHELKVEPFQAFGKGLIKKFKVSPDAFVQMMIQLAYYKFYGICRPTYEAATTRRFQEGRTEACRTLSEESVAFCKAMEDSESSNELKIQLFRAAVNAHIKYISDASAGRGVDRHLFGLQKCLQDQEQVPELFTDPTYKYSSSWFVSTSQLSSDYFNGYGWSQVIDQGWGIAYMINEDSLNFNVVSKRLGSERMAYYLNEAGLDLRDLLLPTIDAPKPKL